MQLFSADTTIFKKKKIKIFFDREKLKNRAQK